MHLFETIPSQRQLGIGLLILRLALGTVFLVHGGQKLMMGAGATAGMFADMGAPAPSFTGPFFMAVEPLAGAALVLGVLTRVAALAVAVDMAGALLTVHVGNGFFVPAGIEFPMMLLASALALMVIGAGAYSIDHAIAQRRVRR